MNNMCDVDLNAITATASINSSALTPLDRPFHASGMVYA
jgi:hypothetical protein